MTLRVRQTDKALVESLLGRAQTDYKNKIKKDVQLKIDSENFLSADTCGGIELIAAKGRIKVTLDRAVSFNTELTFKLAVIVWYRI